MHPSVRNQVGVPYIRPYPDSSSEELHKVQLLQQSQESDAHRRQIPESSLFFCLLVPSSWSVNPILFSLLSEFYLNINACREVKFHKRIYGLLCRIENIDQSFMSAD